MPRTDTSSYRRSVRHKRVRKRVIGTAERPRMSVFRSLNHVYAQIIDDTQGTTLAAASSLEGEVRSQRNGKPKIETSKLVGALVAERAKEKGVSTVVFDRGGHKYQGRVKALAEAAKERGLAF